MSFFKAIAKAVKAKLDEGPIVKTKDEKAKKEADDKDKDKDKAKVADKDSKDSKKPDEKEKSKAELEKEEKEKEREREIDEQLDSDETPDSEIGSRLAKLCLNEQYCDVYFVVGTKPEARERLPAHKVILAARSDVFAAMFYSGFAESNSTEIDVDDCEPAEFKVMLRAIYYDAIELTHTSVMPVLFVAKKYGLERLRRKCVKFMGKGVDVNNALMIYDSLPSLLDEEKVCLQTIEDNAQEILASEGFTTLSKAKLLTLVRSDALSITESFLWKRCVAWAKAERVRLYAAQMKAAKKTAAASALSTDSKPAAAAAAAGANAAPDMKEWNNEVQAYLLKDVTPHIRFPLFDITEIAGLSAAKVLPPEDLLKLFQFAGSTESVREVMAKSLPWSAAQRDSRAPTLARMRFLICGADGETNVINVLTACQAAYKKHFGHDKKAAPDGMFQTITIAGTTQPADLKQRLWQSDAVLVWDASSFPESLTHVLREYNEAGGGHVTGYLQSYANFNNTLKDYVPMVRAGHTGAATRTLVFPTDAKLKRHPVFNNVKTFNGGNNGSYGCTGTLAEGATELAKYSDGSLCLAERTGQRKGHSGKWMNMCFNIYYVSAGNGQNTYWDTTTDGGLLMINCMAHCAAKGSFKPDKPKK